MRSFMIAIAGCLAASMFASAQEASFSMGPVIEDFGPAASVDADIVIPEGAVFKHSFDISKQAEANGVNRNIVSAARFLNMHARAGVPSENMRLALVVHGAAVKDVAKADFYRNAVGGENTNLPLLKALTENGVRVIVCGQSAAYYGVGNEDLAPGVEMALSAMTAHALLQQEGYTVNPF